MNRFYTRSASLCLALCCLSVARAQLLQPDAPAKDPAKQNRVEILRDRWGIANVYADTDRGAMFGLGWATAEDRAFQMYLHVRTMQGRLAEVRGDVHSETNSLSTVQLDLRNRTLGYFRAAQKVARNLDPETLSMLEAYSAGVNSFIQTHPDRLSPLFTRTGLKPEPWSAAHCIAVVWNFGLHFTDDGLGDLEAYHRFHKQRDQRQVSARSTTAIDYGATVQREDVSDAWVQQTNDYVAAKGVKPERAVQAPTPKMSHAWVVGKKKSSTGAAILHSDPQLPVCNPSQVYSFHLSGRTFNVRGVGTAGSPWILIGFNRHVAWGMTGLPFDSADLFLLKTDANRPNQYEFDGTWRDMTVTKEILRVRGGNALAFDRRDTHLGPLVTSLARDVHEGEEVVLVRVPLCVPDRESVQACLPMYRSRNVEQLDDVMRRWMFPPANMLMGDADGNIAYRSVGALPLRSSRARWEGRAAQPGWESEFLWQEMVPHELMPRCINPPRGYLASANQRCIASFYPIPSGFTFGGFGGRGRRLYERMEARDAFTPADVLDVHYDMVNVVKRDILKLGFYIRDEMKSPLSTEAAKALRHVEHWYQSGARMDNRVTGTALMKVMPWTFDEQLQALVANYGSEAYRSRGSDLGVWFDMMFERLESPADAVLNPAECAFIDTILADAWKKAVVILGPDPARWQQKAVEQYRQRKLAYYQDLDGFPSMDPAYDIPEPDLRDNERLTLLSQQGQSYSQSVSLRDPDAALALEPVGASEHPSSPYRLSTYQMWAEGKLHPAPLSREAVNPLVTYRTDVTSEFKTAVPSGNH